MTRQPVRHIGCLTMAILSITCRAAVSAERPAEVDLAAPAIAPASVITLFDGRTAADLRHFYTWLGPQGYDDPDGVFGVAGDLDGGRAIRISGQHWGGLVTRKSYRDYRLVVEFRWGDKTWTDRARNSGILFHCQGEDGNHTDDFKCVWLSSVEYEIQEGRTGAVILVPGFLRDKTPIQPTVVMRTKRDDIWDPAGEPRHFKGGFLFQSTYDTSWKDVRGVRGARDPDRPVGQWNRVEVVAKGGDIGYFLNGTKVLEATDGSYTGGRFMLQSEGAEIFFRLVELHPLAGE